MAKSTSADQREDREERTSTATADAPESSGSGGSGGGSGGSGERSSGERRRGRDGGQGGSGGTRRKRRKRKSPGGFDHGLPTDDELEREAAEIEKIVAKADPKALKEALSHVKRMTPSHGHDAQTRV